MYGKAGVSQVKRSIQEQGKRSKLVHLTPKGKKVIGQAMDAAFKTNKSWLDVTFTEKEFKQLRQLLSKAASVLEQKNKTPEGSD